ncbi:hypothetical protein, partial [Escherichia coli]|uniref:hypothetical protein n=1 Tax=Escherichia coli TaxID=562 RepID=UPI001B8BBE2C
PFRLPGVTFFCISDTLVPTTYLVDTTLSNSSDSDQTVQAVRLPLTGHTEQKYSIFICSER